MQVGHERNVLCRSKVPKGIREAIANSVLSFFLKQEPGSV